MTPSSVIFKEGMTYTFKIETEEGSSFSYSSIARRNGFTFMATEQVAFTDCNYPSVATATLKVKNTGSAIVTIDKVLINNQLNTTSGWDLADRSLDPGQEATITIHANGCPASAGISGTGNFVQGANYAFTVVTSKINQFGPYTKTAPS